MHATANCCHSNIPVRTDGGGVVAEHAAVVVHILIQLELGKVSAIVRRIRKENNTHSLKDYLSLTHTLSHCDGV